MSRRVLVVDDHADFRRMVAQLLVRCGFDVVGQAGDGAGALRQARQLRPDVVLLDVLLPDLSGFAVAQALTRDGVAPQIVLTSSRSRETYTQSLLALPDAGFLCKDEISAAALAALCGPP